MDYRNTTSTVLTGIIAMSLLAVGIIPAAAASRPPGDRPNLVILLADDLGYADVGFNGCRDIPTPHIDSIARQGVRMTQGYVSFSVCAPSRAGLITGRYQDRFGFCRNPTINPAVETAGLPLTERTLADHLAKVGYTSVAIGKWHLGTHPTLHPLERGFDEFFGFLSGGHNYFPEELTLEDLSEVRRPWEWYRTKLLHNHTRVAIDDYLTDELSDFAVSAIEKYADRPFFLYVAYNAPHTPLQATEKYLARFPDIKDPKRKTYAAMVSALDDGIGRILEAIDRRGLAENTLVVFLSDNGGPFKVNGSRNLPLRDGKGSPFEGGIRVPFAMRWTGTLPAGVDYTKPVISLDIAATILARAGVEPPRDKPLDGVDLLPYLTGKNDGRPHDVLYWRWFGSNTAAIREGDYKWIANGKEKPPQTYLFDVEHDISESRNLVSGEADRAARLQAKWEAWASQMKDPAFPGLGTWNPAAEKNDRR